MDVRIERRRLIEEFFAGKFGEDLFDNCRLAGSTEQGKASLVAYLALYAEGGGLTCVFEPVIPTNLTRERVTSQLQKLQMTSEQIAAQYTQIINARDAPPELVQQAVVDPVVLLAVSALGGVDLPIAFLSYLTMLDGSQKIVFWYVRRAPGDVLLDTLKLVARETHRD